MSKRILPVDNFTRLPNQIPDEWIFDLGEVELKIILVLVRKTYGWGKLEDKLSISQFMKLTGFSKSPICRALKRLTEEGYIEKTTAFTANGDSDSSTYSLNVVDLSGQGVVPLETQRVVPLAGQGVVPLAAHTKETNTKETNTKEREEGAAHPAPKNLMDFTKNLFGKYVKLSKDELAKLKAEFGSKAEEYIESYDLYLAERGGKMSNGKVPSCCYSGIRSWGRREKKFNRQKPERFDNQRMETGVDVAALERKFIICGDGSDAKG